MLERGFEMSRNYFSLQTARMGALAAAMINVAFADAVAQEVGKEKWSEDVPIISITTSAFNSVYVDFEDGLACGEADPERPGSPKANVEGGYIIPDYTGEEAKDLMHRTLMAAHLSGRRVDLALVTWRSETEQSHCAVKRVRVR